jgi:hypothetical protein
LLFGDLPLEQIDSPAGSGSAPSDGSSIGPGAVAGIIVGAIAVIAVGGVVVVFGNPRLRSAVLPFFMRRRNASTDTATAEMAKITRVETGGEERHTWKSGVARNTDF